MTKRYPNKRLLVIRLCIFAVTVWNLQAAISLLIDPVGQSSNFMLEGPIGKIIVLSIGILFIMWNIPYIFALLNPIKWKILLLVILIMQVVGLVGEFLIYPLANNFYPLHVMLKRFVYFDAVGLLLLITAFILSQGKKD